MKITLDISDSEFDAVVGTDLEVVPTIFLDFPRDIQGDYKFELVNATVNIFDFKDQLANQSLYIDSDAVFVFGKITVSIKGVKGADFMLTEGDFFNGRKQYHTWPYLLNKGDVVCISGGKLSFLADYYATVMIVTTNPTINLTFDSEEIVPYDFTDKTSVAHIQTIKTKYCYSSTPGKLFNHNFFRAYLGSGRKVITSE